MKSVNTAESGIFINNGECEFTFVPLPCAQRETGRYDSGISLVMVGDGTGGFHALPPFQSGINIDGEVRYVELIDFDSDGDLDLSMTRRNSSPLRFINNCR